MEVLPQHEQKHEYSCVAWGWEFILKINQKIGLEDYPIQSSTEPIIGLGPCNWGFGANERKYIREKYGLILIEDSFEFPQFEKKALEMAKHDQPVVFSMIGHTWVAVPAGVGLLYLSRKYNHQDLLKIQAEPIYDLIRKDSIRDYKIHCLLHA